MRECPLPRPHNPPQLFLSPIPSRRPRISLQAPFRSDFYTRDEIHRRGEKKIKSFSLCRNRLERNPYSHSFSRVFTLGKARIYIDIITFRYKTRFWSVNRHKNYKQKRKLIVVRYSFYYYYFSKVFVTERDVIEKLMCRRCELYVGDHESLKCDTLCWTRQSPSEIKKRTLSIDKWETLWGCRAKWPPTHTTRVIMFIILCLTNLYINT